jgi:hypothetical protein
VVGTGGGADPVLLETDSGVGYHFEARRQTDARWGWGVDFFWFTGAQNSIGRQASGEPGAAVHFDLTGSRFSSGSSSEVLFFERLEDTDMNAWTADAYASWRLSERPEGTLRLFFGVRNADFDNDNRAVAGLAGLRGTRIDASSNYGRMIGPIVGLIAHRSWARSRVEAVLAQAVVQGDVDLSGMQSDFVGAFAGEAQDFTEIRSFSRSESVTIPITDLRLRWTWSTTPRTAVGLGASVSRWTDVSVPPGVRPGGELETLYETSITFSGLLATFEVDF